MSFDQCEALSDASLNKHRKMEEERIRVEEIRKVCQYINCSLSVGHTLCPEHCVGRK